MKKLALLTLFCSLATGTIAAPNDGWNEGMSMFKAGAIDGKNGFRIPAISSMGNGGLMAVADIRYAGATGNTDIFGSGKFNKVAFAIKVSYDGGNTWLDREILYPTTNNKPNNGLTNDKEISGITDPALIYDQNTNTAYLFGYNNNKSLTDSTGASGFHLFISNDDGKSWETKDLKTDILSQVNGNYKNVLQGPGSGMIHDGIIYMPIQLFDNNLSYKSTVGFIYSNDNGKTWKTSELLDTVTNENLQESNIFIHNGEIHMAAKNESSPGVGNGRVLYKLTHDSNGKETWVKVEENFLPDNLAKAESSSYALSDQVYLVGYTTIKEGGGKWDREDVYLTTNTGKKIKLWEGATEGYTSITADQDNLYVLYEVDKKNISIQMRRFDISAKEYANINAQILNRSTDLLDIQEKLFASRSYLTGEYASQDNSGVEAVLLNGNYKIGAFHKNSKENSKDVYRTIEYNTEDTTLVLSQDNVITNNDNIFAGYQYTKLNYLNGSKNDINSFVVGYSLNHKFDNEFGYNFGINGIYSNNKLNRNEAEGLGKSASFDSYSISLKNELYQDIKIEENTNLNLGAGLRTTYFGHDEIKEKNGNEFNDAHINSSTNFSNEIYLKASAEHNINFNEKFATKVGASVGYSKELMNIDDWRDKFTILDVEKDFARPVEKHSAGIANVGFHLTLDFADKVETTLAYNVDSTGEGMTTGRLTYKF